MINEQMADRVREMLVDAGNMVEEKKMFGGLCFMVNDKMCIGIMEENIMVRLDRAMVEKVLTEKNGCRLMTMGGREMKGYVYVDNDSLRTNRDLSFWIRLALDFNPLAQASKKRK